MLNKPTADATVKDLLNKDLFTKEFRNGYTGIVMKLAPGSGYLNVEAETIGDISLKVKIGNDAPKEMISDGKQTAPFQYNVNDETYVYIYASENTPQARNLRSGSADSSVMLYNIEISDTPNDISSITTSAENTHIFDLQGNRLEKPHKGVNVIRMKDGKTKKVVVKWGHACYIRGQDTLWHDNKSSTSAAGHSRSAAFTYRKQWGAGVMIGGIGPFRISFYIKIWKSQK